MESSDLFSHPHQPEVVEKNDGPAEPVADLTFSDLPQRNPSTTPSS